MALMKRIWIKSTFFSCVFMMLLLNVWIFLALFEHNFFVYPLEQYARIQFIIKVLYTSILCKSSFLIQTEPSSLSLPLVQFAVWKSVSRRNDAISMLLNSHWYFLSFFSLSQHLKCSNVNIHKKLKSSSVFHAVSAAFRRAHLSSSVFDLL